MNDSYFVRVRGRTLGPYDIETIRLMVRRAQVGRSHDVSHDGASWMPASTFPEIFERPQPAVSGLDVGQPVEPDPPMRMPDAPAAAGSYSASGGGTNILWHFTMGGQQQASPVDKQTLLGLIASGRVSSSDSVWNETMTDWIPVAYAPELSAFAVPPTSPNPLAPLHQPTSLPVQPFPDVTIAGSSSPHYQKFIDKKVPAGIMALFFGALGIHKFMLGLTTGGLTMLLLFFLIIPIPALSVIALVEAVIYLSKRDELFFQDYAVKQKQWF